MLCNTRIHRQLGSCLIKRDEEEKRGPKVIFSSENLSLVPKTSAAKEHFKLVFGSGTSDLAKIRPLKIGRPAISWKS